MKIKLFAILSIVSISCAHVKPIEMCQAVCSVQSVTDTACFDGDPIWGTVAGAYDAVQCVNNCTNDYEPFEYLDYECIAAIFAAGVNQTCPDLSACL